MKFSFLFILAFFAFGISSFSQMQKPGDKIISGLKKWYENNPQEKVFVQTDRDRYLSGETIWLKAWCSMDGVPGFLSKILYVTLTNENGEVIEKKMYSLDSSSSANGVLDLNRNLKSGNYILSAYTLWMLNYPQFVFTKPVFIYGNGYTEKTEAEKKSQLNFFPEGGEMIEEVKGRVAFKAVNQFGLPVKVQGAVYANNGNKIIVRLIESKRFVCII